METTHSILDTVVAKASSQYSLRFSIPEIITTVVVIPVHLATFHVLYVASQESPAQAPPSASTSTLLLAVCQQIRV